LKAFLITTQNDSVTDEGRKLWDVGTSKEGGGEDQRL